MAAWGKALFSNTIKILQLFLFMVKTIFNFKKTPLFFINIKKNIKKLKNNIKIYRNTTYLYRKK